jgi:hypothetical protein
LTRCGEVVLGRFARHEAAVFLYRHVARRTNANPRAMLREVVATRILMRPFLGSFPHSTPLVGSVGRTSDRAAMIKAADADG